MAQAKPVVKARSAKKMVEADLGLNWGRTNNIVLGLGVLVLVLGYVALSKGSTTLAPALLVLGYVGLIPASLVVRGRADRAGE